MSEHKSKQAEVIMEGTVGSKNDQVPLELTEKQLKDAKKMTEQSNKEVGTIDPSRLAMVSTGLSYTKNLGNYESARLHVEVTLPCDVDNVTKTHKKGLKFVEKQIEKFQNY